MDDRPATDDRRARADGFLADFGLPALGAGGRPLDRIWAILRDAGMLDVSGSALLSPEASLVPGPIYYMGLNPGGASDGDYPRLHETLALSRMGVSAWSEQWGSATRRFRPGDHPLQKRFRFVAGLIGQDHALIPASNLHFARSREFTDLATTRVHEAACLEVHHLILSVVRPRVVWLMGDPNHARQLFDVDTATARLPELSGGMRIWTGSITERRGGATYRLLHTPHMSSRWRPEDKGHPDLLRRRWAEVMA